MDRTESHGSERDSSGVLDVTAGLIAFEMGAWEEGQETWIGVAAKR